MSMGLQIRDSSGNIVFNDSDLVGRFVQTVSFGLIAPRGSTFVSIPGYSTDGRWFLFIASGLTSYLAFTESANGVSVFNSDYYTSRGNVTIIVYRT